MVNFEACPKCHKEVTVVQVPRRVNQQLKKYFFIHCQQCGYGTKEAYHSEQELAEKWHELIDNQATIANLAESTID